MNSAKIPLTRLYRKVSARSGEQYFVGRLGAARILLFKDRDQPAEGDEVFSLLIEAVADDAEAPAPARPPRPRKTPIMQAFDRLDAKLAELDDAEAPAPSPQKNRTSNRQERNSVVAALRRIGDRLEVDDAEATVSQTRTP